jgi:hypothetical protein
VVRIYAVVHPLFENRGGSWRYLQALFMKMLRFCWSTNLQDSWFIPVTAIIPELVNALVFIWEFYQWTAVNVQDWCIELTKTLGTLVIAKTEAVAHLATIWSQNDWERICRDGLGKMWKVDEGTIISADVWYRKRPYAKCGRFLPTPK